MFQLLTTVSGLVTQKEFLLTIEIPFGERFFRITSLKVSFLPHFDCAGNNTASAILLALLYVNCCGLKCADGEIPSVIVELT